VALLVLAALGHYSHPGLAKPTVGAAAGGPAGHPPSIPTSSPATAQTRPSPADAAEGKRLFASEGCIACHKIDGKGGTIGPDLSDEGGRNRSHGWLAAQLRDPKTHDPSSVMPSYKSLSEAQIEHLVDYLESLRTKPTTSQPAAPEKPKHVKATGGPGLATRMIGNTEHGGVLFAQYCQSCHGKDGRGHVPNPGSTSGYVPALRDINRRLFSTDPLTFATNVDRFIQYGATPPGPHPQLDMPAFGANASLTQQQIANIEAYILHLNGVDRAAIIHPGVTPGTFFLGALAVCAVVFVLLGIPGLARLRRRD
jgi:sulfur oxidation c-type cytochrome SoxX